jgi:hypothetical protein
MTLPLYTSAGFGEVIGTAWLNRIKAVANGVRQEIPNGAHGDAVNRLVREVADSGLKALFLVGGWVWVNPDGSGAHEDKDRKAPVDETVAQARQLMWACGEYGLTTSGRLIVECGPELDIDPEYKRDTTRLAELCHGVSEVVADHNTVTVTPMVAASVSNVTVGRIDRLAAWLDPLPSSWWAGVHPYRTRGPSHEQPAYFPEFDSAEDMRTYLDAALNGKRYAITEAGWHDGMQRYSVGPFGIRKKWSHYTREEIASYAKWDVGFWSNPDYGTLPELYSWFQIRDGAPDASPKDIEAHFGAHLADGTPKPVAHVLSALKG